MVVALFNSALLTALEKCVNQVLTLDASAGNKLGKLAGRVLRVECTVPAVAVNVLVCETGIRLTGNEGIGTDAVIRGTPGSLLKLLITRNTAALKNDQVIITGDAGLVDALNDIFSKIDVDWEFRLSRVIGDIPTQLLSDGITGTQEFVRKSGRHLVQDLDAWLHEERKLFPSASETEAFYRRIDGLRLRVDRLQARADKL